MEHVGQTVRICGWVHRRRRLGGLTFIDLRDHTGIVQLVVDDDAAETLRETAEGLGREYVVRAKGQLRERSSKNPQLPTGEVELALEKLEVLSEAQTPPFTLEDDTDGGPELRMQYRYLDLRRAPLQSKLRFRARVASLTRRYLEEQHFLEVETPFLIKSTPEGARDFVVPSRLHPGQAYALPQSPQTFKQLLMLAGCDRYFQMARCFRDEDLRADRQPEFTQIDCEMSFVDQEEVMQTFEGLIRYLLKELHQADPGPFPRMSYPEAIRRFGSDKPDLRFGMPFVELNALAQGRGFKVFDQAELVVGIVVEGAADYSRKQLDELTQWVKRPQIGAQGLVYVKFEAGGQAKSSVDKFFAPSDLESWREAAGAQPGDLLLVLAGAADPTRKALSELRLEMARRHQLAQPGVFKPVWIVDFPLLEWDEASGRYYAMHHPFTAPMDDDWPSRDQHPGAVRAKAYDLTLNGVEIGGGSIRIHQERVQREMFQLLGFSEGEAERQFGFLLEAFRYGAPPHGGIAFGFDRLCAVLAGEASIRDFIAFPKNNAGRDVMINAPDVLSPEQWSELGLKPTQSPDQ